jgi:hypothetical protein
VLMGDNKEEKAKDKEPAAPQTPSNPSTPAAGRVLEGPTFAAWTGLAPACTPPPPRHFSIQCPLHTSNTPYCLRADGRRVHCHVPGMQGPAPRLDPGHTTAVRPLPRPPPQPRGSRCVPTFLLPRPSLSSLVIVLTTALEFPLPESASLTPRPETRQLGDDLSPVPPP